MANATSPTDSGIGRRQFLKAAGAFGLGATAMGPLLAACGGQNGADSGGGTETIELTVSNHPTLLYSVPWLAAIEQGFYEEADLDLEGFVGSEGGGTTVRNVVTGGLPLGAVATPSSISAYEAGAPLKIIAGSIQTSSEINFVTLPDRGINSIEDMRGKSVGFTNPGSVTHALAALCLRSAGIDPATEVKMQAMGGLSEALTGLKEGVVDLAPHILPTILTQEDEDWKIVFWTDEFIPSFMQLDIIAGTQPVEEQPELIQSLIDIYQKGVEFTIEDPEAAAKAWSKHSEVPEGPALESIKKVDPSKYYGATLSTDGLNSAVEAMKAVELLSADAEVDWEGVIDQQFLPEDMRSDLGELN